MSEGYEVPLSYRGDRSTFLYSSIIRLYPLNPEFEIVHDESAKVYLHIHVQRECSAEPSMVRILCHYVQFLPWESLSVDEHKRSPARMLLLLLLLSSH